MQMEVFDISPLATRILTWTSTEEIPLNFSFALDSWTKNVGRSGHPTNIDVISGRDSNYNPYQLYCFLSKMTEKLKSIDPLWSARTIPKKWRGRAHLFLEIYSAGTFVPMDMALKDIVESHLDECYNLHPEHCLIFSASQVAPRDGLYYPPSWVESVIPFLQIPATLYSDDDQKEWKLDAIHVEGSIYIRLHRLSDYSRIVVDISRFISDQIYHLYSQGVIVLHSVLDAEMIEKWRLISITQSDGKDRGLSTYSDYQLEMYKPDWKNDLICNDRVRFLLERCTTRSFTIKPLGDDVQESHEKLVEHGIDSQVMGDRILISPNNYFEAELVLTLI